VKENQETPALNLLKYNKLEKFRALILPLVFCNFLYHYKGNTLIDYLVSLGIGYLIGSIPTAYLVVKRTSNIDIRTAEVATLGEEMRLMLLGRKASVFL
jgi:hypothetical protein